MGVEEAFKREVEEWLENTPTLGHERRALQTLKDAQAAVLADSRFGLYSHAASTSF